MIYSKTLELSDYDNLPSDFVEKTYTEFKDISRFEHKHRRWEYGMALQALLDNGSKNILEVGGGGSLLVPLIYLSGSNKVTAVDPWDCNDLLRKQEAKLELEEEIEFYHRDFLDFESDDLFDAVVCTSVIEHVPYHEEFFKKLLSFVDSDGILVLTTDFYPTSERFSDAHLRTYSEENLMAYVDMAEGFTVLGDGYDYTYTDNHVYQYTFASLVLKRNSHV